MQSCAGRTRNAVLWKLGQRVFGLKRDRENREIVKEREAEKRMDDTERRREMERV